MKTMWRHVGFCTFIMLSFSTPVLSETASKQHATPTVLTNAPPLKAVRETRRSTQYQTAYAQGQQEAQANIAMGKPSIYTVGKTGSKAVDRQTGFPTVSIAGCIVNDSILGRRDGYNDRMREWASTR